MARKITSVYTRPNATIQWFQETFTQDHRDYMANTYFNVGKAQTSWTESEDGLTLTMILIINDTDAWGQDSTLMAKVTQRDEYNASNGITLESQDVVVI
jgi:hypothetical protein